MPQPLQTPFHRNQAHQTSLTQSPTDPVARESKMHHLTFRVATVGDASAIQSLIQDAFRAEDTREGWTAQTELNNKFQIHVDEVVSNITKPNNVVFIVTGTDHAAIGTFLISKRSAEHARFALFAVHQDFQRGGVGRKVLSYAEDYCRSELGVQRLEMNALSTREQLIQWYMRQGYRKTGRVEPFPAEQMPDIVLPADLCFVMLEKNLDSPPDGE